MEPKERRQLAIKQIRNTLIRIAEIDDTCNLNSLLTEVCSTYGVSLATAKEYIIELINLGIAKVDWKMGWIWHNHENEIRKRYLERKQEGIEVIKVKKDLNT